MNFFKELLYKVCERIVNYAEVSRKKSIYKKFPFIHSTVQFGSINIIGEVRIDEHTYLNEGALLSAGKNSRVIIGKHCAIGRYVHISAKTHSLTSPTTDEIHQTLPEVEKDTIVGDYVWIGDKVFVREGVKVGDFAVVAANSVVNRDVLPFEIVGGVPIKHIRFNTQHYKFNELKLKYHLSYE